MQVSGKVAIVAGSSSGVGAEVMVKLGQLGVRVAVNYASSLSGAEETAARIQYDI